MNGLVIWLVELVAFFIIVGIVWRKIVPLVRQATRGQQDKIAEQMAQAEQAKRDLAEAEAEYRSAVERARDQAAQIRENARAEAQRSIEELRIRAEEESARIVARGEEQLVNQRSAIVRDLRTEIGALAVELSEQVVEQVLSDRAQASASIDALLDELERRGSAAATTGEVRA